ncbi:hypothetical protein CTAYLR_008422 [Chrysophaeum taylorii]|uniref:Uncharacterized protein n=1 Tax=Chrysophaeum taylorii TaxID=2483200 RepID=A0AAD7UJF5_9STRA|nr:hypothetical protein CTAYLR_008422 [Chrysophaeum taylorii]
MPVVKTGEAKAVGTVTYTSWDKHLTKTTFALDEAKPPLLWRTMEVGMEKVEMSGEACVSLATAIGQIEAYQTKFADCVTGDDMAAIAKTLTDAAPADPKDLVAAEKEAEAAAAAEADY